jgi:hypothetical protein
VSARGLVLLLAIGAPLISGCGDDEGSSEVTAPGEGITRQISGRWTGTLHQEGLKPFEIAADIGADGSGEVAYSGIECGGDWTFEGVLESLPPGYGFKETIEEGAGGDCKGTGTVSLSPIQSQAPNSPAYSRMTYRFDGGGVTSRGVLRRTDIAHLAPIFEQAGVTRP